MRIGVLTSSRADYGIYLPLLRRLKDDSDIQLSIIAFGTHLKSDFGYTLDQIKNDGYTISKQIDNLKYGDSPQEIALNYGHTTKLFAKLWNDTSYDYVLCLGDRYEMAAAVNAGIPFDVRFVHLHAGETSKGAIDNIYRDQISIASDLHFVALKSLTKRIEELTKKKKTSFFCGAIGLENIDELQLLSKEQFLKKWGVNMNSPTILMTVHPETMDTKSIHSHIEALKTSMISLLEWCQILVTMPNADTQGSMYRSMFKKIKEKYPQNLFIVENLGTQSYFSAMTHCKLLIGNTSSGIIEAASFKKFVINLGNRQLGRVHGDNIIHVPFDCEKIISETMVYFDTIYSGPNIYELKNGSVQIIKILKDKLYGIS